MRMQDRGSTVSREGRQSDVRVCDSLSLSLFLSLFLSLSLFVLKACLRCRGVSNETALQAVLSKIAEDDPSVSVSTSCRRASAR